MSPLNKEMLTVAILSSVYATDSHQENMLSKLDVTAV